MDAASTSEEGNISSSVLPPGVRSRQQAQVTNGSKLSDYVNTQRNTIASTNQAAGQTRQLMSQTNKSTIQQPQAFEGSIMIKKRNSPAQRGGR